MSGNSTSPVPDRQSDYRAFLESKKRKVQPMGFEPLGELNTNLFPWQADIVRWALRRGRAAVFADCGLGKSLMQLEWACHIHSKTGLPVVVHCPLGVRLQTRGEAEKFGIQTPVAVVNNASEVVTGINLVNYEKLHLFDGVQWGGVVLDESGILKNFVGKTKQSLVVCYRSTPYRLCCTATAAPNDHMELGNHSEFLGIMPSNEMLSRWFINDTMKAGGYRLKKSAVNNFWEWVASWAVCISKPSDLGYPDDGYILPPLEIIEHILEDAAEPEEGELYASGGISATTIHTEKRKTIQRRAAKVAELVCADPNEVWLIWCETDYEADELRLQIPEATEIRGSTKDKEGKLLGFAKGEFKRLITKPSLAGFGQNWQHCARVAFVGIGYSFEQFYQALRRTWRFGQTRSVQAHIVSTDAEYAVNQTVYRKQEDYKVMQCEMAKRMSVFSQQEIRGELQREQYQPTKVGGLPSWLMCRV